MNSPLFNRRTLFYFGSSAAFLSPSLAQGQVLYTDINPDIIIGGPNWGLHTNYFIDINQDGTNDVEIGYFDWSGTCTYGCYSCYYSAFSRSLFIDPINSNFLIRYSSYEPTPYNFQDSVTYNPGYSWFSATFKFRSMSSCASQFNSQSWPSGNHFVALRLKVGNAWYMGWLRSELVGWALILKDFAINTTTSPSIVMGTMATALSEHDLSTIADVKCQDLKLTLSFQEIPENASLKIISLMGQVLSSQAITDKQVESEFKVPGVYLLSVETAKGVYTHKLFVH